MQLHVLQHSLGVDCHGRGRRYRNHFVTDLDSTDGLTCLELCAMGLMVDHGAQQMYGGMHGFTVTDQGQSAVTQLSPPPPKLSRSQIRYRDWLRVGDVCGMRFGEWLKAGGRRAV